jgi:hypothetical protein
MVGIYVWFRRAIFTNYQQMAYLSCDLGQAVCRNPIQVKGREKESNLFINFTLKRETSLMRVSCSLIALAITAIGLASACQAAPVGLWEFEDSGNLTAATIGSNFALTGADAASSGSGTLFDAGAAQLGIGSYYTVTHGIGGNGGGSYVNEYTLLWDVMYPQSTAANWKTLLQTAVANSNDGDLFIRNAGPQGAIGVFDTGYSTNTTAADTWYRIVLSVDNTSHFKVYVDGNEWLNGTAQPLDTRFSLDPTFHVLADNDGDDALINLSNFAIWDSALDASAIGALGGAGRQLNVPEPCTIALLLLASVGAFCRRHG